MLYKRRECRFWRIKYYRNGQPVREGAGTEKEAQARRILRERLDDLAVGWHVLPYADRVRFEELAEGFLTDYRVNGKRSLDRAEGGRGASQGPPRRLEGNQHHNPGGRSCGHRKGKRGDKRRASP